VLLASGYIAGGAISGIIIAFVQVVTRGFNAQITDWAEKYKRLLQRPECRLAGTAAFLALTIGLYLVGRSGKGQADRGRTQQTSLEG